MIEKIINGKTYLFVEEVWKDIPGFEGYYQVSNFGRAKSVERVIYKDGVKFRNIKEKIFKFGKGNYYSYLSMRREGKVEHGVMHVIIAKLFIANPENKPQVNHKNGIKWDNRVQNLEWATRSENIQHSYDTGLQISKKGKDAFRFGKVPGNARICQCLCTGRIILFKEAYKELAISAAAFSRMMANKRPNWSNFIPY